MNNKIKANLQKNKDKIILILQTYLKVHQHCTALYLGGSFVDPVIDSPHDLDGIWYCTPNQSISLNKKLENLGFKGDGEYCSKENLKNLKSGVDLSQIEIISNDTLNINWFSYLVNLSIHIAGDYIDFNTDVIGKDREAFLVDLKNKASQLTTGKIANQKRWYHILRGIYILMNNSYDVSEEQKRELNILHDLSDEWEQIRDKAIQLLKIVN